MSLFDIIVSAFGLSMDAFAVAICLGLNMHKVTVKKAGIVGLYFGFFQALMPLIGYFVARLFASSITAFDHWIAFALLTFLGVRMALASFEKQPTGCIDRPCPANKTCLDRECNFKETSLAVNVMLPFALATSIDALAVGVSFAVMQVDIFSSVAIIGIITLICSMLGVKIGNVFGTKIKSKAELLGGIILLLIGIKILIEHLI